MTTRSFTLLELELWNSSERHMENNMGGGKRARERETERQRDRKRDRDELNRKKQGRIA